MSTRLEFRSRIRLPHECCDLLFMLSASNQLYFLRFALFWLFPALLFLPKRPIFPTSITLPLFSLYNCTSLERCAPSLRAEHQQPNSSDIFPTSPIPPMAWTRTKTHSLEDLADAHPNSQSEGPGGRPPQQSIRRTWRTPPQQTVHHSEDEPAEESHHPRRSCA